MPRNAVSRQMHALSDSESDSVHSCTDIPVLHIKGTYSNGTSYIQDLTPLVRDYSDSEIITIDDNPIMESSADNTVVERVPILHDEVNTSFYSEISSDDNLIYDQSPDIVQEIIDNSTQNANGETIGRSKYLHK